MSQKSIYAVDDRKFVADPVYLSDLSECFPSSALSPDRRRGYWQTLRYETNEFSGVMLIAGSQSAAKDITYPLILSGWHSISIGIWGAETSVSHKTLVRLTNEEIFTSIMVPSKDPRRVPIDQYKVYWNGELTPLHSGYARDPIWEIFWKVADLTELEIMFGQETWRVAPGEETYSHASFPTMPAYIKVVPLSDQEINDYKKDVTQTGTRRLFVHMDVGWSGVRPTNAEELKRNTQVELYRESDYSRIYIEAARGDRAFYLSDIASVHPYASRDNYYDANERLTDESWDILRGKGIDPFQVVVDHIHEVGLEVHASITMGGFNYNPPLDKIDIGRSFFKNHPELHGVSKEGKRSARLSYAYPKTRGFVISILREIASYSVDGIALLYNRKFPYVEYEPPLIQGFIKEFGDDPRDIDKEDTRWLKYRSRILTQFMREVRQAMDDVAQETGRDSRIGISAVVGNGPDENILFGMDVDAWVKENLVDTIIPYTSAPRMSFTDPSWEDPKDAEYWINLTKDTSTVLALGIRPAGLNAVESRKRVLPLYDAGVENFYYWDGGMPGVMNVGASHVMRRLGHKAEIADWINVGEPSLDAPMTYVKKLGDWNFEYMTPG